MSFFGALEGLGRGIAGEGEYLEKLNAQRELQREKALDRADLDRQRNLDRAERERDNLLLRSELGLGGKGKGSGSGGMNLFDMAQSADTPQKQDRLIESVRAFEGDDAANVLGRMFGRPPGMETVNPTAGDSARYDRTLDENGQSAQPAPASYTERASVDAEKGRVGLKRLLGLVAGKSKDQAEGEARNLGTDAVRGATDDAGLRRAGAVNMALEGKDRRGVADGTEYDKAGVAASTTTDVGKSKINENNAQAGKYSADAKKVRDNPIDSDELRSLQQLRMGADARLKDARKALTEFDKNMDKLSSRERAAKAGGRQALQDEISAARREFDTIAERLTSRLDRKGGGKKEEPAKTGEPRKITSEAQYRALKSGTRFIAPDGTTRIKP